MHFYLVFSILFLLGTFFLTSVSASFRRLRRFRSQKVLSSSKHLFFYALFQRLFFKNREFEILFLATVCARHIVRFAFGVCALIMILNLNPIFYLEGEQSGLFLTALTQVHYLGLLVFIFTSLLVGDLIPRTWATYFPYHALRYSAPIASLYLLACFPLSFIFLKISTLFTRAVFVDQMREPSKQVEEKIIEIIQETDFRNNLDANDKKIIKSMVTFRDRIVREVMVPRIEIFSLPAQTSIKQAALQIKQEGYSRVPVFSESIDNILGVLMYKDIIELYQEALDKQDPKILDQPIEGFVKPVLFTPETKKISDLLQEFKSKQSHLAIVVDEYGGTEGLATIEDILEEIVGEIEDEYDEDEDKLYFLRSDGVWELDARMTIIDIEEKLGLKIPHEGDYDTIGGYVYHKMGTIPAKGVIIHHDEFELEVLQSNERCVEKISITPIEPHSLDKLNPENKHL